MGWIPALFTQVVLIWVIVNKVLTIEILSLCFYENKYILKANNLLELETVVFSYSRIVTYLLRDSDTTPLNLTHDCN